MTTLKTSELIGPALDWAVTYAIYGAAAHYIFKHSWSHHTYSTNWSQGGPIIEREGISTLCVDDYEWAAGYGITQWDRSIPTSSTPLIAAMRCFVASKLGDEVDVPEELK